MEGYIELEDGEDMDTIISNWYKVNKILKEFKDLDSKFRDKIKIHLKEREWDSYSNKANKINVRITVQEKESADLKMLKMMLNEKDYAKAVRTTTFEKMNIVTPEIRNKMKSYIKN